MKNKAFGFYTAALTLILTVATLVAVLIYGSKGGVVNSLVPIALGAAAVCEVSLLFGEKVWTDFTGIIAAALTLIVFCRIRKISFFSFADLGVHGLLIGQCIGRWGNFMNVEAYGGVTGLPWRMCSESIASSLLSQGLVDADGYQAILDGTLGVHPTFFYESLWNFVGIFLIYWIGKHWKKFDGQVFWSYVLWYGLGRFWIEGLRTDSLYFFGLELFGAPIRTSQVLAIVSAAVAAVVLIYELKFRRHDPSELYVNRLAAHRADAGEGPGGPEKKED